MTTQFKLGDRVRWTDHIAAHRGRVLTRIADEDDA